MASITKNVAPDAVAAERKKTMEGRTHDKIPGFDPAAAPMETDEEAGSDARPRELHRASLEPARPSQSSYASAMRQPARHEREVPAGSNIPLWLMGGFVAIAAVVIAASVLA